MKTRILILTLAAVLFSAQNHAQESDEEAQNVHQDPTHNFTLQRLIVLNDKNEMLMNREDYVWAPPSAIYDKREYVNESIENLASTFGITITTPQLHGYFGYKYDYHPYSTLRTYYVARYVSGTLKTPKGRDEAKWVPLEEALEISTVTAIKQITQHIVENPDTVWGGSFMVSREEKGHPTKQVEAFYPLFQSKTR
ncbi:MAG: hypothetical protein AAF554_16800 [Bacteroidota bacterium]